MQTFLHRACWAAKRGDKIFWVLRHDLLWSLPANLQEYQLMANFRIFRRVHFEHASNAMAISHWILRFGNNLQGSSRQKSRFALFCRFLHRVCGALRLVYVHVSVLNVSFCYLKDCRLEGEELKQIRTKTRKVRCNCTEQRVALLLKN